MAKLESITLFPHQCGLYQVARGPCFILQVPDLPWQGQGTHSLPFPMAAVEAVLPVSLWMSSNVHTPCSPCSQTCWGLGQTWPRAAFCILEVKTSAKERLLLPLPLTLPTPQKKQRTLPEAFKMPVFLHSFFSTQM